MLNFWKRNKSVTNAAQISYSVVDSPGNLVERASRIGKGPLPLSIVQQVAFCIDKCPRDPQACYNENATRDPVIWIEERKVIHACADGSQWTYKAREGVRNVYCPLYKQLTDVRVFEASVLCDILSDFHGCSFNFVTRTDMTVKTDTEVITVFRPSFTISAVEKSWDAFVDILEKEMEDKSSLDQFILERKVVNA